MARDLSTRVQQSQQVQQRNNGGGNEPQSIGSMIQSMRGEIARALPKHMDADRMARIALTVVRKTPKLAQCTPESFMGALLSASQLGLEPGVADECYLVPYDDRKKGITECQLIIGYQGYAKLFWQHPMAKHIDAQAVYAADEFDYAYGLEPFLKHKPFLGEQTGQPIAYYAVAALTTGGSAFVVLSPDQVKKLRGGKTGTSGGIADPMHWMERKTCLRQLFKLLPKSTNLARALEADEKIRTDLREDAIDAPMREIAGDVVPPQVQTEQGTVDTSTGEIQEPPAGQSDAEWFEQVQAKNPA